MDSPALTYAEVKAIASGNPLVLEKAKVDAEVMRLTRLRAQHRDALYQARTSLRMAQQDVPLLEGKIANLAADLAIRQNTKGDAFRMVIEGRTYTQREAAGERLGRLAQKHLLTDKTVPVGEFAGFRLQIWPERSKEIVLCGKNSYAATVSESALGTISSMEHMVRSMDERAEEYRKELAETQKRIVDLQPHTDKPFEHEEKLQGLVKRQQEIMDALDLEKNQASNQLDAEVAPVVGEATSLEENETTAVGIGTRLATV